MLYIISIIAGIYLGIISHDMDGALAGGIIGFLFAQIIKLNSKIQNLEILLQSKPEPTDITARIQNLPEDDDAIEESASNVNNILPEAETETHEADIDLLRNEADENQIEVENENETPVSIESIADAIKQNTDLIVSQPIADTEIQESSEIPEEVLADISQEVEKQEPSVIDIYAAKVKSLIVGYFTSGNLIVRIGLLVLFVGVAFLLKYVAERTVVPVEFRYIAISAGSLIMMMLGWKLLKSRPGYAVSLLGGGIGVLYLTLFAAMRLHGLLSPSVVIILMIGIVLLSAMLSILTHSMPLAIMGMAGGYAAPILTSTGSGNHVHLFSYYLLLNTGVFLIAWFRSWRILNVLGFVATFGIGSIWGYQYYTPEYIWSVEPFLIANFLMYTIIAVLFAFRQPPNLKGLNDGTLIFGTPLVGFSLQAGLMKGSEYGLAYSALALGVFYILLAFIVKSFNKSYLKSLIESFVALGIGFATLAIPLGFDGRVTSAMWVAEGSALVWVGVRQSRLLPRMSGYLLTLIGSMAFFIKPSDAKNYIAWLNADFIGALIIVAATLFIALYTFRKKDILTRHEQEFIPHIMSVYSIIWWLFAGINEINLYYPDNRFSLIQLFISATTVSLLLISARFKYYLLKSCSILVAFGMLIVLQVMPALNENNFALLNDRFIGLMIVSIFHFILSWLTQNNVISRNQPLSNSFLFSSLIVWVYAFVTEVLFYQRTEAFLLIELLLSMTAFALFFTGKIKNMMSLKISSVVISLGMIGMIVLIPDIQVSQTAIMNISFMGFFVYSMTQLIMSRLWQSETLYKRNSAKINGSDLSNLFLLTGLISWYLKGLHEISIYINSQFQAAVNLLFLTISTLVFVLIAHKIKWKSMHYLKYAYLPSLIATIIFYQSTSVSFITGYCSVAWIAVFLFNYWLLKVYDNTNFRWRNIYHIFSVFMIISVCVILFTEYTEIITGAESIWYKGSSSFALIILTALLYFMKNVNKWPLRHFFDSYFKISLPVLLIVSCIFILYDNLTYPGQLSFIPYLPIFNIIDISGIFALFIGLKVLQKNLNPLISEYRNEWYISMGVLGFILINAGMLRSFHYWYEIPYQWKPMWNSFMIQTGFSILWTITSLVLMILSTRKEWRNLWLTGMGLIIAVVAKLFLVDMSASGTIERIVAFLSVGVLLSVIGYFSPIPPDKTKADNQPDKEKK